MGNGRKFANGSNMAGTLSFTVPPNDIIAGDGFYVSFNEVDVSIYGCETTALVLGQMEAFYILNGDHRAGYAPLMSEGFEACMEHFMQNVDRINLRSDKPADTAPRP